MQDQRPRAGLEDIKVIDDINERIAGFVRTKARYTGRIRRNYRTLRRAVRNAAAPGPSRSVPVTAYWWATRSNFGDQLTEVLLPHFGVSPVYARAEDAELVAVGSIIEHIPDQFPGYIWGSGFINPQSPADFPDATILALRGESTLRKFRQAGREVEVPLGDPGLLASRICSRRRSHGKIGLIPHFSHQNRPAVHALRDALGEEAVWIDVTRPVRQVIREISACTHVVSTSLHGIVVADSFGIPGLWALVEPLPRSRDFKWRDYESVVHPRNERRVDLSEISTVQDVHRRAAAVEPEAVRTAQDGLIAALQPLIDDGRPPRGRTGSLVDGLRSTRA